MYLSQLEAGSKFFFKLKNELLLHAKKTILSAICFVTIVVPTVNHIILLGIATVHLLIFSIYRLSLLNIIQLILI